MIRSRVALLPLVLSSLRAVASPAPTPARPAHPPATGREAAAPAARSGESPVVAIVNGEKILLRDVERQVALVHMEASDTARPASQDPSALLERMIRAILVAQEAGRSGIEDVPEVRAQLQDAEKATLRDLLVADWTNGAAATPQEIDAAYKNRTRQFLIQPVLVSNAAADDFDRQIKGGAEFVPLAKKFRDAGTAHGPADPQLHRQSDINEGLAHVLTLMKPGETSPPQKGNPDTAFIHLFEVHYADDPQAHKEAAEDAAEKHSSQLVERKTADLRTSRAVVDKTLLASLDFEKDDAVARMKGDDRPLVKLQDGSAITVAQFAEAMKTRFFHGLDKKRTTSVNNQKPAVLEDQINRRVVVAEARRLGLEKSPEFRQRLQRARRDILFGAYVEKAVLPDVKYTDADLSAYLQKHQKEFTMPEMVRFEGIAFQARPDAERALAKLESGAEFGWLAANAEGRVAKGEAQDPPFPPTLVGTDSLPPELRKSVKGVRVGSGRFYAESAAGPYWLLRVAQFQPETPAKLEDVRSALADKVYAEKVQQAMDSLCAQLREAGKVTVVATGTALRDMLKKDLGAVQ